MTEKESPILSARAVRALIVVIGVLALGLGTANLVLWRSASSGDGLDAVRASATASANTRVPKMLTYSYKTIDADIATATDQLTGDFKTKFGQLMTSQVRPGALAGHIITHATSVESGVISTTSRTVKLLLFLDLSTTSGTTTAPQINGSRVEVTMTKVGDNWLISALEPV